MPDTPALIWGGEIHTCFYEKTERFLKNTLNLCKIIVFSMKTLGNGNKVKQTSIRKECELKDV